MRMFLASMTILWSSLGFTQTVNLKISTKSDVKVYHYGKKSGGIKCGNGDNGTYRNGTVTLDASDDAVLGSGQSLTVGARTANYGWTPVLFSIKAASSVEGDADEKIIKLSVEESQEKEFANSWQSGCDDNHYFETLKNASYKVDAEITYTVPEGVWVLDIEESDYEGSLFTIKKTEGGDGHLQNVVFKTKNSGARRVWVKPGSIIKKVFKGHNSSGVTPNPKKNRHEYWVKFKPVGKLLSVKEMNYSWINKFVEDLLKFSKATDVNFDTVNSFITKGASVLRSKETLREALKSLPTNQLMIFANQLFNISVNPQGFKDPELENSLRLIAALTSYEVSNVFVEELSSYCEMKEVNLPYTMPNGETKKVLGLHYATFLMDRMKGRINGPLINAYRSFVQTLEDVAKKHPTYASIFSEKELKYKLRDSYNVLRETAKPQKRPFAQALQDLMDFYKIFRSVGTGEENTDYVIEQMRILADMENRLLVELFAHIDRYTPGNNEVVDFSALNKALDDIEIQAGRAVDAAKSSMRFLSLTEENGFDGFSSMLTSIENKNIAIIAKPYKVHEFEFNFEEVRKAFVENDRVERNLSAIQRCQKN